MEKTFNSKKAIENALNMQHGYLSEKQLTILKKKIAKYAGQLTRLAIEKGLYVKEGKVWMINGK